MQLPPHLAPRRQGRHDRPAAPLQARAARRQNEGRAAQIRLCLNEPRAARRAPIGAVSFLSLVYTCGIKVPDEARAALLRGDYGYFSAQLRELERRRTASRRPPSRRRTRSATRSRARARGRRRRVADGAAARGALARAPRFGRRAVDGGGAGERRDRRRAGRGRRGAAEAAGAAATGARGRRRRRVRRLADACGRVRQDPAQHVGEDPRGRAPAAVGADREQERDDAPLLHAEGGAARALARGGARGEEADAARAHAHRRVRLRREAGRAAGRGGGGAGRGDGARRRGRGGRAQKRDAAHEARRAGRRATRTARPTSTRATPRAPRSTRGPRRRAGRRRA